MGTMLTNAKASLTANCDRAIAQAQELIDSPPRDYGDDKTAIEACLQAYIDKLEEAKTAIAAVSG